MNQAELAGLTQTQIDSYWMPYTGNREFKADPRIVTAAKGKYLTDAQGRQILDSLSGLWTCGAGHSRPEIAEAVYKQLNTLDYAPGFQFGHPLAFQLAERMTQLAPEGLNRVCFTNSGSEAVDTATKIARAYWRQCGHASKTRIIGRLKGYHGASWGGISFGGIPVNRKLWGQAMESDMLGHTWRPEMAFSKGMPKTGSELANELSDLINLHDASNIAAVIVEPFSGSAGVIVPPEGYLQRLRQICTANNILLIFDEVITGLGRSGARWGADAFGVKPDLLCFAKQVTNGAVPLGGVLLPHSIYDAFMEKGGAPHSVELPHGFTYSGHPVACAAAMATLDILDQEQLIARVASMAPEFETRIHSLKGCKHITDIRNFGFAGGMTLEPKDGDPTRRPYEVALECWKRGVYVRWGGDTLQLGLPFTIETDEIDRIISTIADSIESLYGH